MALGLAFGTLAPTLPWFVALVGGLGGIGIGLTGMVTQAALLADTYVRRRGLANGIAFSGSMAGFLAACPPRCSSRVPAGAAPLSGTSSCCCCSFPPSGASCRFV